MSLSLLTDEVISIVCLHSTPEFVVQSTLEVLRSN